MSTSEMQLIAKNSGVSIGLVITLAVFVFFGGMSLGRLNANLENHEMLEIHKGADKIYVPRTEVELQFKVMQNDINQIKKTQAEMLRTNQAILIEVTK